MKLKLCAIPVNKQRCKVFDVNKLRAPQTRREFPFGLRAHFSALDSVEEEEEKKRDNINIAFKESAEKVLDFRNKDDKQWTHGGQLEKERMQITDFSVLSCPG